jgi:signal transduction histidine kinase
LIAVAVDLIFPWASGRTWRSLAHVSLTWFLAGLSVSIVSALLSLALGLSFTFVLLVPMVWVLFTVTAALGRAERSRVASLLGVAVPSPHSPLRSAGRFARAWERTKSPSRWREIAYLAIVMPIMSIPGAVAVSLWAGAAALVGLPAYVKQLAGGEAHFYFFTVGHGARADEVAAVGVVGLLWIAPWITLLAAAMERGIATRMLGPSERTLLTEQVRVTETRRAAAVETAESERQRIERDLHDGAQQRLVALAMDLGRAREHFDADPDRTRDLIAEAHDEAKAALGELRDLVRGVHPAILGDRGLDAALSSVVARSPVPVDLTVDVARRPSPEIESAAYFFVSEALTNVARHARASRAAVTVARVGGRLIMEVSDNGAGGADPSGGTGLAGLAGRMESLGGRLQIVSPLGGPTTVMGELPC